MLRCALTQHHEQTAQHKPKYAIDKSKNGNNNNDIIHILKLFAMWPPQMGCGRIGGGSHYDPFFRLFVVGDGEVKCEHKCGWCELAV